MLLGSLFKFALDEELIDLSPAQRLPIPAKSEDRERTLDAKEIAVAWAALSTTQPSIERGVTIALQLSLVLGQRIGAAAGAREVDLDLVGTADPELVDSGPRWRIRGESGTKARQDRTSRCRPWRSSCSGPRWLCPAGDGAATCSGASGPMPHWRSNR
jgi:integrase